MLVAKTRLCHCTLMYSDSPRRSTPHQRAHLPRSCFFASALGLMSNSKMSMGRPMVVHAFGMSTMPAIWPSMGMHDSMRYI